jgi:hypothetical protein
LAAKPFVVMLFAATFFGGALRICARASIRHSGFLPHEST